MTLDEINSRIAVVSFQLACVYLAREFEGMAKPGYLAGTFRSQVYKADMRRMVRRRERQMELENEMRVLKQMRRKEESVAR